MAKKKKIIQETVVLKAPEIEQDLDEEDQTTPVGNWKLRLLKKKLGYIEQALWHLTEELQNIEHNMFHECDDDEGH